MNFALRLLALSSLLVASSAYPQTAPTPPPEPPVQLTPAQDHKRFLDLLHIEALRPAPNSKTANYDESKANPWPNLPDPLRMAHGKPVNTPNLWWNQRRPQLTELFDREVFGRVPTNVPSVQWRVVSSEQGEDAGIPTLTRHLIGHADNSAYPLINVDIELAVTTPAKATGPVPLILELTFENYPRPANRPQSPAPPDPLPTWKQLALAKGWGYALLYPTTIQPDNGPGLTQGIIGLTNHGRPRTLDDWGALRAWAWGASRALDFFTAEPQIDAHHIAIAGHSRFGKASLVAMAYDQRFAAAYINSSGAGGADLARRRFGEQLENIAAPSEYHWMDGNYLKYAGPLTPADMPVDTNELIALCAPRPVFIGGGTVQGGDGWADVPGTFLAEAAASPVYQLLGAHGLGTTTLPPVGTALTQGDLAFRQHPGGHTPAPDWPYFLDFAARYLQPRAQPIKNPSH